MLKAYASVALLAAIVAGLATYQAQEWRYGKQIADIRADHADAIAAAERTARATEARMQTAIDNIQAQANEQAEKLQADIDSAERSSGILREKLASRTSRAIADTRTTGGGEAARETFRVYSELLDRADARDRAVSEFADRAYAAGVNCVQAYNEIRSNE